MKKINLRGLSEKLSARELKNVLGGSEYGGCLPNQNPTGTCCVDYALTMCGISRNLAIFLAGCEDLENGTNCEKHWCCDSCSTATWNDC